MKIELIRDAFTNDSTTGRLFIDGLFICYTLEDRDRYLEKNPQDKVRGQTAIPIGTYSITRTMSPRFKKILPRLANVPGFDGVLIHSGNTSKDTEGCILVGKTRSKDFVGQSREAFAILDEKIKASSCNGEKISITIIRQPK